MAIDRWRPMDALAGPNPLREIQREMNRVFESFFGRPGTAAADTASPVWTPTMDLHETNDELRLDVELPGVSESEISLSINGDVLTVKGERPAPPPPAGYLHAERAYGKFERLIRLPVPVQSEHVTATYRDGILHVRLPKVEAVRPREIKVEAQ